MLLNLFLVLIFGTGALITFGDSIGRRPSVRTQAVLAVLGVFGTCLSLGAWLVSGIVSGFPTSVRGWVVPPLYLLVVGPVCFQSYWRHRGALRSSRSLRPSLRIQLALILLPVLILAVVGCIGLYRDQAAVESETRRQAQALTDELVRELSGSLPSLLGNLELTGNSWIGDGVVGPATVHWPGERPSTGDPFGSGEMLPDALKREFRSNPAALVPVHFNLDAAGRLIQPVAVRAAPIPPDWISTLPLEAKSAWNKMLEADSVTNQPGRLPAAVDEFLKLKPDHRSRIRAEWILLRAAPASIDGLLDLGRRAVLNRVESDTGIPLGAVLFAEAIRRTPGGGSLSDVFALARGLTFVQPSLMTPWILDQVQVLAQRSGHPEELRWVAVVRSRWEAEDRLRFVAATLESQIAITNGLTRSLWLKAQATEWWTVLKPGEIWTLSSSNGHTARFTNAIVEGRTYRVDAVEELALAAVTTALRISAPNAAEMSRPSRLFAGTKLALRLDGRDLSGHATPWFATPADTHAAVLGESTAFFTQTVLFSPDGDLQHLVPSPWEPWPTHPALTVRLLLTDRAALFAAQRRQQLWFGGMILLTAAVAGAGTWQTHRAFARQLAVNEQKSNFVSAVSHELRAPRASLRLLAEGLADGRIDDEGKRREYAGFLVQETRRLGALVENVLGLSRIDAGRSPYEFVSTDLARLTRETTQRLQPVAAERGIQLEYSGPDPATEPVEIIADGLTLQQALINLIDNALKHAPAGTPVVVSLEAGSSRFWPRDSRRRSSTHLRTLLPSRIRAAPGNPGGRTGIDTRPRDCGRPRRNRPGRKRTWKGSPLHRATAPIRAIEMKPKRDGLHRLARMKSPCDRATLPRSRSERTGSNGPAGVAFPLFNPSTFHPFNSFVSTHVARLDH